MDKIDITTQGVMKTAASHLRKSGAELKQHREFMDKYAFVTEMIESLPNGEMSGPEFIKKFSEYMNTDIEELKVLSKAIEITKTGEFKFGTLSDKFEDDGSTNPLIRYLLGEE